MKSFATEHPNVTCAFCLVLLCAILMKLTEPTPVTIFTQKGDYLETVFPVSTRSGWLYMTNMFYHPVK